MIDESTITDVRNYLNGRIKGREARAERIASAGVPMDRKAMQCWLAAARRDKAAEQGSWFRGGSVRVANGVAGDLPVFGKFGCQINLAMPMVEEVEDYEDEDNRYSFYFNGSLGISGGCYGSKKEAMDAAKACMRSNGFVADWRMAAEVAKSQAEQRHLEQQERAAKHRAAE